MITSIVFLYGTIFGVQAQSKDLPSYSVPIDGKANTYGTYNWEDSTVTFEWQYTYELPSDLTAVSTLAKPGPASTSTIISPFSPISVTKTTVFEASMAPVSSTEYVPAVDQDSRWDIKPSKTAAVPVTHYTTVDVPCEASQTPDITESIYSAQTSSPGVVAIAWKNTSATEPKPTLPNGNVSPISVVSFGPQELSATTSVCGNGIRYITATVTATITTVETTTTLLKKFLDCSSHQYSMASSTTDPADTVISSSSKISQLSDGIAFANSGGRGISNWLLFPVFCLVML